MHSSTNPCVLLLPYLDSWIYILVILVHYILIHIPRTSIKKLRESTRGTSDRENCEDTHKPSQSVPTFSGLVMHKVLLNLYSNIICNFLGRFRVIVVSSNIHWNLPFPASAPASPIELFHPNIEHNRRFFTCGCRLASSMPRWGFFRENDQKTHKNT